MVVGIRRWLGVFFVVTFVGCSINLEDVWKTTDAATDASTTIAEDSLVRLWGEVEKFPDREVDPVSSSIVSGDVKSTTEAANRKKRGKLTHKRELDDIRPHDPNNVEDGTSTSPIENSLASFSRTSSSTTESSATFVTTENIKSTTTSTSASATTMANITSTTSVTITESNKTIAATTNDPSAITAEKSLNNDEKETPFPRWNGSNANPMTSSSVSSSKTTDSSPFFSHASRTTRKTTVGKVSMGSKTAASPTKKERTKTTEPSLTTSGLPRNYFNDEVPVKRTKVTTETTTMEAGDAEILEGPVDTDSVKSNNEGNHTFTKIAPFIIAILILLVLVALIILVVILRKNNKNNQMSKEDAEAARLDEGQQPGRILLGTKKKPQRTTPLRKPVVKKPRPEVIECAVIDLSEFKDKGPVKLSAGLKNKNMRHETSGEVSHSLKKVYFNPELNQLHHIGSKIEIIEPSGNEDDDPTITKESKEKIKKDKPSKDSKVAKSVGTSEDPTEPSKTPE